MPLHFTCPFCQEETLVDDQFAGLTGPCASCGKQITVPYFAESQPPNMEATAMRGGHATATAPLNSSATATAPSNAPARRSNVGIVALLIVAGVLAAAAVVGLLLAVGFPIITKARATANRGRSSQNLRQIAAALNAYAADNNTYPPAFIADANGKPMHSWRVLLLPYLGKQNLYDRYDFTQPWDSPLNLALQPEMPKVYACPGDLEAVTLCETSYMVVRGKTTAFPGRQSVKPADLSDGFSNTVLVVEVTGTGISWMEPADLALDSMQLEINSTSGADISSVFVTGAHVVTADEASHFLPNDTQPEEIRALLTIDAGDYVDWSIIAQ